MMPSRDYDSTTYLTKLYSVVSVKTGKETALPPHVRHGEEAPQIQMNLRNNQTKVLTFLIVPFIVAIVIIFASFIPAQAGKQSEKYQQSGVIVPSHLSKEWAFDGGWIDNERGLLYQADFSNKSVDIISLSNHQQIGTITGDFQGVIAHPGPAGPYAYNGPNHVIGIGLDKIAISDGDSSVSFFDTTNIQHPIRIAKIATGGKVRADGMAFDPQRHLLAIVNSNDPIPFVSFIDVRSLHLLNQHIWFSAKNNFAASGLDDIEFDQQNHQFYLSATGIPTSPHPYGAIVQIDPVRLQVAYSYHIPYMCDPAGLAIDDLTGTFAIACGAGNPLIMKRDGWDNADFIQVQNCDSGDFVGYMRNKFFFAEQSNMAGPIVAVVDIKGNLEQKVPSTLSSHSVTVDAQRNTVYLPEAGVGIVILSNIP